MARAAYRALNGALTVSSVQSTVHPLNESDGSLNLAALGFTASVKRALANDVTVCGEHEPVILCDRVFSGRWRYNSIFSGGRSRIFLLHRKPQSSANFLMSLRSIRVFGESPAAQDIFCLARVDW